MTIKTFSVSAPPKHPSLCISGPVGSGKTTLIGTMPGRGLIIDVPQVEGGAFVLADKADRIKGVTMEDWEDIDEVYLALYKQEWDSLGLDGPINWVAIDSITGMAEMGKRKITSEKNRDLGDDPHDITLREWGKIGNLVGEMVYRFQKLPLSKVWIAQERTHGGYDDDPGPVQIGPQVTRSVLLTLKTPMTIMGRLSVEGENERRVLTVGPPGGTYIVKARVIPGKKLPNRILAPHLGRILKYMFFDGPKPKAAPDDDLF